MKHVVNIETVERRARQGGCIILYANCRSPLPEQFFESCEKFRAEHQGWFRQAVLNKFEKNCRILKDAPPELNLSMAQLMLALNDCSLILAMKDVAPKQAERIGLKTDTKLEEASITLRDSQQLANIVPS